MPTDWPHEAQLVVEEFLDKHAADVDRTGRLPREHLDELARRGFYGLVTSEGITPDALIDTASTLIGGCLTTGFVWAQHIGALRSVAWGANSALRERYMARMQAGDYRCGVSYAGARSAPTLFAQRSGTGDFIVSGTAPFVTGWGYIDAVATAVRVREEAGESVATLLIPVQDAEGLSAEPLPLIAADASSTVRLTFDHTVVDAALAIDSKPVSALRGGTPAATDWFNGVLSLGVLSRCVRELKTLDAESAAAHEARCAQLRARFTPALGDEHATYALRADLARAGLDAAAAVAVATGSTATTVHSTAERLLRQATFALVCTTRDPIKIALLQQLTPPTP
ncbi:hypothetical protein [Nocardia terpenica]|uniref:Acyl-CoA dehydrogenase n=1 Tax=Nocardia terpenica TaxID=455432 RepID=A0A6G9Z4B5_9NOCA|nr:hypothetical protein [Nocardia terpenica]QIS20429.1 hypothetical protein F6W96_21155 [Nocardia terpenica]